MIVIKGNSGIWNESVWVSNSGKINKWIIFNCNYNQCEFGLGEEDIVTMSYLCLRRIQSHNSLSQWGLNHLLTSQSQFYLGHICLAILCPKGASLVTIKPKIYFWDQIMSKTLSKTYFNAQLLLRLIPSHHLKTKLCLRHILSHYSNSNPCLSHGKTYNS